jgi:hypothetical protein
MDSEANRPDAQSPAGPPPPADGLDQGPGSDAPPPEERMPAGPTEDVESDPAYTPADSESGRLKGA